jgi:hypothetical protein
VEPTRRESVYDTIDTVRMIYISIHISIHTNGVGTRSGGGVFVGRRSCVITVGVLDA